MNVTDREEMPDYLDPKEKVTILIMKNTFFQRGSHRANGINSVYRDSSQKKLR